jgi:hypothetical protein
VLGAAGASRHTPAFLYEENSSFPLSVHPLFVARQSTRGRGGVSTPRVNLFRQSVVVGASQAHIIVCVGEQEGPSPWPIVASRANAAIGFFLAPCLVVLVMRTYIYADVVKVVVNVCE